jgi:hypothetical protein
MNLDMTIDELVTELTMASSSDMNLIVEGDADYKFFSACLEGIEHVNLVCAWGCENVKDIIEKTDVLMQASEIKPTLGIIDLDYRIPLGKVPTSSNILFTDFRDLECMMFDSRSFNNVVAELASKDKLRKMGGVAAYKRSVIAAAEVIARVRYYSQSVPLNVCFKKLDIESIICKNTLRIQDADLYKHLNARQGVSGCILRPTDQPASIVAVAQAKCQAGKQYFVSPMMLCRGHDLMEIIGISMKSLVGTLPSKECTGEKIEKAFRLSYPVYFKKSQLAKGLQAWLSKHALLSNVSIA